MAFLLMLSMLFADPKPEIHSVDLRPIESIEITKLQVLTHVELNYGRNDHWTFLTYDDSKPALDKFKKDFIPGRYTIRYQLIVEPNKLKHMKVLSFKRIGN
jgi:hypothetical protein